MNTGARMNFIGLDAGSVSVKLVILDENGNLLYKIYRRHKGHPLSVTLDILREITGKEFGQKIMAGADSSLSITGSAGRLIASVFGIEPFNEIISQAYSSQRLCPHIKTIIEMGGEDSKLILLGEDGRSVKDFSMNSVCAAGTGSFLDQQAERLRISIEEFSELALISQKPPRIAGRCSVFAKSDMIHLQQIATRVEDIIAGLCFAVARNFKGSIARGRTIIPPVSFQGGVAANKGMVRALKEIFALEEIYVPEHFAFMGAIGASLKNIHEQTVRRFDLSRLDEFLQTYRSDGEGHPPLNDEGGRLKEGSMTVSFSSFIPHPSSLSQTPSSSPSSPIEAYLGIDIGSISTNLAVIDTDGRLLAKRYLMTAGRPIEAVQQGLAEIGDEIGDGVEILGVGTTGSGRYMIADFVGADIVKNEITAQATAAAFINKDVDTIFEIGGQDSKYISLENGIIVDFEMNKACAAGTGSFLEEQAEKLNISIKEEFAQCALSSKNPCRLGERCTVFMENSLMSNLQRGADRNDLLAGLAYSIVQNYINRVVAGKRIGSNIFFQGGVAFNKSVAAAFEKYLGRRITIPPHHDVTGAIGMGLIAMKHMRSDDTEKKNDHRVAVPPRLRVSTFKGFELSKRPYEISSFECKGCPNICKINRVKISGEKGLLFYGGRCDKYDVLKKKTSPLPDLFAFREEMLWQEHNERMRLRHGDTETRRDGIQETNPPAATSPRHRVSPSPRLRVPASPRRPKIGIPYIFFFHDYLPFWATLLWELGFDVEVSPKTNRQIVTLGLERVLSEACFPVKVAYGHIRYLLDRDVDAVFVPSFINLNTPDDPFEKGLSCPYTQTIPYVTNIAFGGVKTILPVVDMRRGDKFLISELRKALKPFGIGKSQIAKSLLVAHEAQTKFASAIKAKGAEVLSGLSQKAVVIVGRAYNAFDSGVNLEIPKKLADIGIVSIPFDFLPIEQHDIGNEWPNMYWRSGQRILKAARAVRENRSLHAIYISNFLCGPDSFILKYFKKEMGEKPFLSIEIDEHSADAGAITRCEAFIDSIGNRDAEVKTVQPSTFIPHLSSFVTRPSSYVRHPSSRTVYLPRMSDHVFAIAAAFERCGVQAEVLPESDKKTADIGRKYVSGKECYPCTVTTGDMMKKVMEPGFIPEKSAFFMPSGTGPCRFGQYNVFHRLVLDNAGYKDVPIFSPVQDTTFYSDLGIVGRDFTVRSWQGILAYEFLTKCLHATRPYEKEKGASDAVYGHYLQKLYSDLRLNNANTTGSLKEIRDAFEHLPKGNGKKPLIGIVGEIFVRSHKFSNEDLIRKVEALGGEVWLAPVEEWIYYINAMGLRKALLKKEKSVIINFLLKKFVQKRIEHRFAKYFEGFLKTLREPETQEIFEKASPYISSSFEGEAILSVGKSIDLLEKGASGLVNAMPFGCMPGTIVTALLSGVSRDFGAPCISIPYDGTESPTTEIQLEAFMDQAKEYKSELRVKS